jgi:hypothetical protein
VGPIITIVILLSNPRQPIYNFEGPLGSAVKMSVFGGESVRTHALTPKYGVIPRQFLKNHFE